MMTNRMKTSAENIDKATGAKHPEKVPSVLCSFRDVDDEVLFIPPNST